MRAALSVVCVLLAAGCVETGQERATVPLRVAGTAVTEPVPGANGWVVDLERADIAFGPLYFCAGYQAGALCETARLEWVESAVVDALDPDSRRAGTLHGVTGTVRSWMYDLGITSLLTEQRPVALEAAEELGGSSVVLAGTASSGTHALPFSVAIPIQQEGSSEIGVSVVRKNDGGRFEHEVEGDEELTVRFDPRPWVRDIDFDALVDAVCGPEALGCAEEIQFTPDTQGYRAVRTSIVAGKRPAFEWSNAP